MTEHWSVEALMIENNSTVDGRLIRPHAVQWPNLPIPIFACQEGGASHEKIGEVVGIERVTLNKTSWTILADCVTSQSIEACDVTAMMEEVVYDDTNGDVVKARLRCVFVGERSAWSELRKAS